jgi:tetratricopeptide (TPR) repeat protein
MCGRSDLMLGLSMLMGLSLAILSVYSPLRHNLAFLQLSDALAFRTQEHAIPLAQAAQLSLESLNDQQVLDAIGILLLAQGETEEAVELWKKSGMPSQSLLHWARYYEEQQQKDFALAWYQAAVQLEPTSAQVHYALGLYYRRVKAWEQAIHAQQHAVELEPANQAAWYELGYSFMLQNQPVMALHAFNKALTYTTKSNTIGTSIIHFYQGHIYQFLVKPRDLFRAKAVYTQALASNSYQTIHWAERNLKAETYHRLGLIAVAENQPEQAILQFQQALKLDLENYGAYLSLGRALESIGQIDEAIKTVEIAVQQNDQRYNAYELLGDLYLRANNREKAEVMYRSALERSANNQAIIAKLEDLFSKEH